MKKCRFNAKNDKTNEIEQMEIVVASTKSLKIALNELEDNYTIKKRDLVEKTAVDFFVDDEIMVEINNVLPKYCKECEDDGIKELVSEAIESAMKAACIFYKESKRKKK